MAPRIHSGIVSSRRSAPASNKAGVNLVVVASAASGRRRWASTGPVSMPASVSIILTPVSSSPARMAAATGAGPRWRGKSEGCTFRQPKRGMARTVGRSRLPIRSDDVKIGRASCKRATAARPRSRSGVKTGNCCASAYLSRPRTQAGARDPLAGPVALRPVRRRSVASGPGHAVVPARTPAYRERGREWRLLSCLSSR